MKKEKSEQLGKLEKLEKLSPLVRCGQKMSWKISAWCPCRDPSSASDPAGWGNNWVKPTLPVFSSLS